MSDFATRMAASSAASAAREAKEAAQAAQSAAEERLEGTGNNPFVTLDMRDLQDIEIETPNQQKGFFAQLFNTNPTKEKLSDKGTRVSIKRTDISYLQEKTDDFGTVFTEVFLEDRCELEYSSVYVPGTLEENQLKLNGVK